jgi:2-polyprenyl-3-methyl-5-hydroxy-6-metoxy-1,4-benzoquinol methylase
MSSSRADDGIDHREVAAANERFYAKTAEVYETTENCLVDARKQRFLEELLDELIAKCHRPLHQMTVLDACGGSGNVGLKLLRRGAAVLNVDVSPDMQEIFMRKVAASGFRAETEHAEIVDFLRDSPRRFDAVVFSSALHHLKDIEVAMSLVFDRLNPGGLLLTVFDPTPRSRLGAVARASIWLDYASFKLLRHTRDVPSAIRRRMRRARPVTASTPLDDAFDGFLAEYHARHGIDDLELSSFPTGVGFRIASHRRLSEARYGIARAILNAVKAPTEFTILAQKPV